MVSGCLACAHPERAVLEEQMLKGVGVRRLAGTYGISKSALARHRAHVKNALTQNREAINASTLMGTVTRLMGELEGLKDLAISSPSHQEEEGEERLRGILEEKLAQLRARRDKPPREPEDAAVADEPRPAEPEPPIERLKRTESEV